MTPSDGKRQVWIIPSDPKPQLPPLPAVEAPGHRIVAAPLSRRRRPEPRPLRLLVRAYGLGPLGTLIGGGTGWEQSLAVLALLASLFWIFFQLPPVASWLPTPTRLTATLLCGLIVLSAWCRELLLAAGSRRFRPERLPAWMRTSPTAGLLGLAVPGLGLMIAGRVGRAALALLNAGLTVQALLVLVALTRQLGPWGVSAAVEAWLAGALLVLLAGSLLWMASALDGARLLASSQRKPRVIPPDRYALALLLALLLFAAGFQPANFAGDLDCMAGSLQARGFRHLPLALELGALRLDPGRSEYGLRAADLAAATDRPVLAGALLYTMRERWQACAVRFGRETPHRVVMDTEELAGPLRAH